MNEIDSNPCVWTCPGCDKIFNTKQGATNHKTRCGAITKVQRLQQEKAKVEEEFRLYKTLHEIDKRLSFTNINTNLVPEQIARKYTLLGRKGVLPLCIYIYFGIPENMTVRYAEDHPNFIWIYTYKHSDGLIINKEWTLLEKNDSLDMMIDTALSFQTKTFNDLSQTPLKAKIQNWFTETRQETFDKLKETEYIPQLNEFIKDFYTRKPIDPKYFITT